MSVGLLGSVRVMSEAGVMNMNLSRLAGLCLGVILASGLSHARAQEVGVRDALRKAFDEGELAGLHSVLVLVDGETFAEVYFSGEDERWGDPTGVRQHKADTLHDLRSVSKSIVGLLYGIALSEGLVPEVDQGLLKQFPDYADLAVDAKRSLITIADALTMRMGTEWDEDLPYTDPHNSEIAMERAQDRYRFVLDRPMVEEPGRTWIYNGGATAIVAKLIADGTGRALDEYARDKLFTPLGITDFEWIAGRDGEPSAASGLRLNMRDLAKIGQMLIDGGNYKGVQVVPTSWLDASFTRHAVNSYRLGYGYFWWLDGEGEKPSWMAGFGNGGQRLTIHPQRGVVIAVFAGNYNQPDAWKLPVKVTREFVIPALRARGEAK